MINRIRVVTLLVMVLGVFALLQLISGSLFFSSLHHSQKSFVVSNQLREQQGGWRVLDVFVGILLTFGGVVVVRNYGMKIGRASCR